MLTDLRTDLEAIDNFSHDEIEKAYNQALERAGVANKDFLQLFRVCLTGLAGGPPLFEIAATVGKLAVLRRIEHVVQEFGNSNN